MKKLVSIIIPIYNVGKYLKKCIESALNQDYENIQIILIDDGSTDDSNQICKTYIGNSKIKFIQQKNLGVSVARNKGIEEALGEYIIFVDGDDYMEETMVTNLVEEIEKQNADIIITPPIFEYQNKTVYGKIFENDETFEKENKDRLELNIICRQFGNNYNTDVGAGGPWGKIYKKEFIIANDLKFIPGLKRMQDVIFNLYAMNVAQKVVYKKIYGYHYRINNNSVCVKYNSQIFVTFLKVINEFNKFLKNENKNEEYYQALYLKTILMYIEGSRISVMHKDNKMKRKEKIKELKQIYENDIVKAAFMKIKFSNLNNKLKIFVKVCNLGMFNITYLMINLFIKSKSKEQE